MLTSPRTLEKTLDRMLPSSLSISLPEILIPGDLPQRKGIDSLDNVPLTVKRCIKQIGLLRQCATHSCDTKFSLVYYLGSSNSN